MRFWKSAGLVLAASGALVLAGLAAPASAHEDDHGSGNTVLLQDRCDPATFNAALGAGACAATGKHHTVTFAKFNKRLASEDPAEILSDGNVKGWRNDPMSLTVKAGTDLLVKNTGGEGHTFTLLSAFGGGCVPPLNAPFHLAMNPICPPPLSTAPLPGMVLPGTTLTIKGLAPGTYRYECLIHPWMRTTVTVSATPTATIGDDDNDND